MKRVVCMLMVLMCLLTACGTQESVVGFWEAVQAEDLGLNLNSGFVDMETRLILTEEGTGAWEIEFVESRQILRREFTYTLEGKKLTMLYYDNTREIYTVSFEDGILHLEGQDNFILKRIEQ